MEIFKEWNWSSFDDSLILLGTGLAIVFAVYSVCVFIRYRLFKKFSSRTGTEVISGTSWNQLFIKWLQKTKKFFFLALGLQVAIQFIALDPKIHLFLHRVFILVTLYQVGVWGAVAIALLIRKYFEQKTPGQTPNATAIDLINFLAKMVFYSLLILIGLNNFGVNINALIAGLGVGGIAIALAVQNILGDLFASLTIVLDKPFVVGEFIEVDQYMGTIEYIGLKTTRARSLTGELVIFSNADLLKSRIRNYKRMKERRVKFNLNVAPDTAVEKLKLIPPMLQASIEAQKPSTRLEYANFRSIKENGYDFEVVYWMNSSDFKFFIETNEKIQFQIAEFLEKNEICVPSLKAISYRTQESKS